MQLNDCFIVVLDYKNVALEECRLTFKFSQGEDYRLYIDDVTLKLLNLITKCLCQPAAKKSEHI